uniref:Kinesin-like protein n=1 Tax=Strigamia maritima TaxID=126957 RepID=T1IXE1_STRMM
MASALKTAIPPVIPCFDPSEYFRPEPIFIKSKEKFRDYTEDENCPIKQRVRNTYLKMHTNQTVEFVKKKHEYWCRFDKCQLTVMEAMHKLNSLVDESDPDVDVPNIIHGFQTAEAIRKAYPDIDWLHLTGLIHDMGKVMALYGEEQWAVVGDTFPVGCAYADSIVYRQTTFDENPDLYNPLYNTRLGIYKENIGLEQVTMSWGHDEYLYRVLKNHPGCRLPQPALHIIRFHSFYPWHASSDYTYLYGEIKKMLGHNGIPTADSGYGDSEDGHHRTLSGHSSIISSNASLYDDEYDDSPDNVSVIIRVRPLNNKEANRQETFGLTFPGDGRIVADTQHRESKPKLFTFNVVFEPGSIQEDIFEHSGVKKLIDMALDGFSSTVFAYGQTGSGKTYTITGPPLVNGKMKSSFENEGLMTRSFRYLFKKLETKTDVSCLIHASFLEIYNEQVIDLLNPGSQRKYLQVRWARGKGFYVENLFIIECVELDDVMAVMEEGLKNRQVAPNNANDYSSRSHCILTLNIAIEIRISEDENAFVTKQGKLIFVDLAGSEKVSEKGTDNYNETNKINRSLLTLGKCISALGDGKKKQGQHIPYRDSKLTKLLADSLGGNGVTLMIACVTPAKSNLAETVNTLRYAARTKRIKNKPVIVMDPRETLILSLQRELENLAKLKEAADKNERLPSAVDPKEIYNMLQEYMVENDTLREENSDLLRARDVLNHDQEIISRENERLIKRLEERESRSGHKSPMSVGRSSNSLAESFASINPDIWVNNLNLDSSLEGNSVGTKDKSMPDSISKELNRRKIGSNSIGDVSKSNRNNRGKHVRSNSWDLSTQRSNSKQNSSSLDTRNRKSNPKPVKPTVSPATRIKASKSEQSLRNLQDDTDGVKGKSSKLIPKTNISDRKIRKR